MARCSAHVDAEPEAVFDVLDDAHSYPDWVVGCRLIRAVDPEWPEPGSSLYHRVGLMPFIDVADSTSVLERDRPHRLKLRARARPTGIAHVVVEVEPDPAGGSTVTIDEVPVEGLPAKLHNPLQDVLIGLRNKEMLRRISRLAERRIPAAPR